MFKVYFIKYKFLNISLLTLCFIIVIGFLIPEPVYMPVVGAKAKDWNKDTFWYEPWGKSGVHKGMDIFAKKGTAIVSTTNMIILYKGIKPTAGKHIYALGPKWRIHYYAHLDSFNINTNVIIKAGIKIGTVGNTGNASGKQAHLHYSIMSIIPFFWKADNNTQGFKKAFYLNPIKYLDYSKEHLGQ
ncbi:MAG: M23 family metallopeptidase [Saccharospirillaceae bacterium]|nr:M23 family metallopeptidase [Saccharospirillaceae bacterium]